MAYVKCKWLETYGRKVMASYVFPCLCPAPELPPMPASITKSYGYEAPGSRRRSHVSKSDCADCPCYAPPPTPQETP